MNFAISTMVESFIQSQKYAVANQLGRRFGRYRALAASPEEFIENVLMDQMRLVLLPSVKQIITVDIHESCFKVVGE